jgi:hypothetical protein
MTVMAEVIVEFSRWRELRNAASGDGSGAPQATAASATSLEAADHAMEARKVRLTAKMPMLYRFEPSKVAGLKATGRDRRLTTRA